MTWHDIPDICHINGVSSLKIGVVIEATYMHINYNMSYSRRIYIHSHSKLDFSVSLQICIIILFAGWKSARFIECKNYSPVVLFMSVL